MKTTILTQKQAQMLQDLQHGRSTREEYDRRILKGLMNKGLVEAGDFPHPFTNKVRRCYKTTENGMQTLNAPENADVKKKCL